MLSQAQGQALRYHHDPTRPSYASGCHPAMHQASGYTQQGMYYTFPYPGQAPAGLHHAMAAGSDRERDLGRLFDRQMAINNACPPTGQALSTAMPSVSASAGAAAKQRKELDTFKRRAQEPEILDHHKFEKTVNMNSTRALFEDTHSPYFFSTLEVNTDPEHLLRLIYHLSRNLHQVDPTSVYGYSLPRSGRQEWFEWPPHRHELEPHVREEARGESTNEGSGHARRRERRERARDSHMTSSVPASTRRDAISGPSPRADSPRQRTVVPCRDNSSRTNSLHAPLTHSQELEELRERFIIQQVELEALKQKATKTCIICYEADIDCVFLECLHMYCCTGCAKECVQDGRIVCSICRKTASAPGYVKVFMS